MRVYSVSFKGVSIGAAVQDLFGVYCGAVKAIKIHEVRLGQITQTSVEILRVSLRILPATVTSGSGGSVATPRPANANDTAATVTARTNDTTQATSTGTIVDWVSDVWNLVNGYDMLFAPEDRPVIGPSSAFIVSLDTAPAAGRTADGSVIFEELF